MRHTSIDALIDFPEAEALRWHLDGLNFKWFRLYAIGFSGLAFLAILISVIVESGYVDLVVPALNLVLVRGLFGATEKPHFETHFRSLLVLYLLLQLSMAAFFVSSVGTALPIGDRLHLDKVLQVIGFVAPFLFLSLRLPTSHYLYLFVITWAGTLARHVVDNPTLSLRLVSQTIATALCFYFAVSSTRLERTRFFRTFRVAVSRNRERMRMRKELDYARQIQLSMLPSHDPAVKGLDIAGASLPATEVGGDYYEYFLRDSGLAVVVGDVAGHGVASGLLLSGIRSCLYLLHEAEQPSPVAVLRRLNRMVRQTTDRRMFITLLYALFDYPGKRLRFSSAGHPPLLHYSRASDTVDEFVQCAPPLGTHLDARYDELAVEFETGDVFVLYTDGLPELRNAADEVFGDQRLFQRIAKTAHATSARQIREGVLSALSNFKGDAEQRDDITMVVVKVR